MRRKAAVKKDSILPGGIYAVGPDDNLSRFVVKEVITRRVDRTGSPHDYKSSVLGHFIEDRKPGGEIEHVEIDVAKLRGEFSTYEVLARRNIEEKQAREREEMESKKTANDLVLALYQLIDREPPSDARDYDALIRSGYAREVEIKKEAIPLVLAALRKALS